MKILAVDTATPSCSVAVVDAEVLLAEQTVVSRQTHARHLPRMIEAVITQAGLNLADLDAFAVTRGPGSFTGLRIGISTVKGLALAADRPIVGVSTLAALALQVAPTSRLIYAMLDARKGEVFWAAYRIENGCPVKLGLEQVTAPAMLADQIQPPCIFVGNGAVQYRRLLAEACGPGVAFVPAFSNILRASSVADRAYARLREGDFDDVASIVPTYIRKSDAELKDKRKPRPCSS